MSTKRLPLIAAAVLFVMIAGLIAGIVRAERLPQTVGDQETIVLGQTRFAPGSASALRLVVRDTRNASPLANTDVIVSLQSDNGEKAVLYQGQTDAQGIANVNFSVPAQFEGSPKLVVETRSALGKDTIEQTVTVQRSFKVLLSTDKPLYQPGQIIHIRALCVSAFDLKPAAGQVQLAITDAKGNKVFQQSVDASAYGIASADFQLADEVNTGTYKITAQMGDTTSERSVTVQHYVLPKFKVTATTDKAYYMPGERVTGKINADYFFGKSVQGGNVKLAGYIFDVERQQVVELSGQTDDAGLYEFSFDLPPYFVGGGLEAGSAQFILEAAVTDSANHTEQTWLNIPVAQSSIVIQAVPESGVFKPGIENIVYVVTMYPDGTPAPSQVELNLDGKTYPLQTGDLGLGTVKVTPQESYVHLEITARDELGNTAQSAQDVYGEYTSEYVLLRPDRAAYHVGDAMVLDVFGSASSGTVYIDVIREGQTVSTRAVDIKDGHAQTVLDLSQDLVGTLTLHAYKILSSGQIVRDTRIALVDPANDLALLIKPDRETYRPGDTAAVDFQVSGPAALGLAVVDESVFALQEQDPGFAKLYFLLEKELMEPKYDLHGFTPAGVLRPIDEPALYQAQDDAAKAALAAGQSAEAMSGGKALFSLNVNSRDEKMNRIYQMREQMLTTLASASFPPLVLLPLSIIILGIWALKREKVLRDALITSALIFAALILLLVALPPTPWGESGILEKLGYILGELFGNATVLFLLCAIPFGLISLIGLAIRSWRARDSLTGWMLILLVGYIVLLPLVVYVAANADINPDENLITIGLLSYLGVPLAFAVRAVGFGFQRRALPVLATLGVSGLALFGAANILAIVTYAPVMQEEIVFRGGPVPMDAGMLAAPPPAPREAVVKSEDKAQNASAQSGEQGAPRLRQYFPETLFWLPEATTNDTGHLVVNIPIADSITTWRLSAIASAQDGRIGSGTTGLRVFQEFFIDLDLPIALTQNDEIAVPVAVYNYLPDEQNVKLTLQQQDWFELQDQPEKTLTIAANDVSVVYFRIKALRFGRYTLSVTGAGSALSDAIQKEITVHPDGKQFEFAQSDRLEDTTSVAAPIPPEAIPGTAKLAVKIYPGVMSQIVEGLEAILQMPYGCFEQTSSTTYPNVLAMDYIKTTGKSTPEIQMKAEQYINLGYQRLTSFEVSGGGFSLFGDAPADRMLTAYGLQEFHDMSRVHPVDPVFIERAALWLLSQQESDGTWENDRGIVHEDTWQKLGDDRLPVTAYIAWSLSEAGYAKNAQVQQAISYIKENASKAQDPYVLALVANALAAVDVQDSATTQALDRLAAMAVQADGAAYWQSEIATMMGGRGQTGSIETTALAAYALIRAGAHPDVANAALTYIVRSKDPQGTWHSTQATVLSLKALLLSTLKSAEDVDATVTVSLNGGQSRTLRITRENYDVVQMVSFDDISPEAANTIQLAVEGKGSLMYQVAGSYYLPWNQVRVSEPGGEAVTINVSYDRTDLRVNDTVGVKVEVTLNAPGTAQQALVDLGIPPGFEVLAEDLQARINRDTDLPADDPSVRVKRYELTGRQILVYVQNLNSNELLMFEYRLRARFPLVASVPSSKAYDYYNPDVRGQLAPVTMTVEE